MDRYLERLKKSSKSDDIEDIAIIIALTGIVFELLGELPDYRNREVINRSDDYFFQGQRTLTYRQNYHQKVNTILEAARHKPFCEHHDFTDLQNIYFDEFGGRSKEFIDWYKTQYSEVYLMIF